LVYNPFEYQIKHARITDYPYIVRVRAKSLRRNSDGSCPRSRYNNGSSGKICAQLSERTAVLFLGAGINYGIKNKKGENFPLGNDLSIHKPK
jgi:hypothetical protein